MADEEEKTGVQTRSNATKTEDGTSTIPPHISSQWNTAKARIKQLEEHRDREIPKGYRTQDLTPDVFMIAQSQSRLDELEKAHQEVQEAAKDLLPHLHVSKHLDLQKQIFALEDRISQLSIVYRSYLQILKDKMEVQKDLDLRKVQPRSYASSLSPKFKLPEMHIPKFGGNASQWVAFYDSFQAAVTAAGDPPGVAKLVYLKSKLTGPPLKVIEGYLMEDSNFELALADLRRQYGKKRTIVSSIMKELVEHPAAKKGSEVRELLNLFNARKRQLEIVSKAFFDTNASHLWVQSLLESKLPYHIHQEWLEKVAEAEEMDDPDEFNLRLTYADLDRFLSHKASSFEDAQKRREEQKSDNSGQGGGRKYHGSSANAGSGAGGSGGQSSLGSTPLPEGAAAAGNRGSGGGGRGSSNGGGGPRWGGNSDGGPGRRNEGSGPPRGEFGPRRKKQCLFCESDNHLTRNCPTAEQKLTRMERFERVKNRVCYDCLEPRDSSHADGRCPLAKPCEVAGCPFTSHRLIHRPHRQRGEREQ